MDAESCTGAMDRPNIRQLLETGTIPKAGEGALAAALLKGLLCLELIKCSKIQDARVASRPTTAHIHIHTGILLVESGRCAARKAAAPLQRLQRQGDPGASAADDVLEDSREEELADRDAMRQSSWTFVDNPKFRGQPLSKTPVSVWDVLRSTPHLNSLAQELPIATLKNAYTGQYMYCLNCWETPSSNQSFLRVLQGLRQLLKAADGEEKGLAKYDVLVLCRDGGSFITTLNVGENEDIPNSVGSIYIVDAKCLHVGLEQYKETGAELVTCAWRLHSRAPMSFRPHQHMIVMNGISQVMQHRQANKEATSLSSQNKKQKSIVAVVALPRSDKMYVGAGLVHMYNQLLQKELGWDKSRGIRALIYSTKPISLLASETLTRSIWTDVFSEHLEFECGVTNSTVSHTAAVNTAAPGEALPNSDSIYPARWVVMSKQPNAVNTAVHKPGDKKAQQQKSKRKNTGQAPAAPPAQDDAEEPEDLDEDEQSIQVVGQDQKLFGKTMKIIAQDKATLAEWQSTMTSNGRPTSAQVIGSGFDIILFDEAHLDSELMLSHAAIERLMAGGHTPLVFITDTYMTHVSLRPVGVLDIRDELLCWSSGDKCKSMSGNLKALADVYGRDHTEAALKYCHIIPGNQELDFEKTNLGLLPSQMAKFKSFYDDAYVLSSFDIHCEVYGVKAAIAMQAMEASSWY